jgi:hypothetical protein
MVRFLGEGGSDLFSLTLAAYDPKYPSVGEVMTFCSRACSDCPPSPKSSPLYEEEASLPRSPHARSIAATERGILYRRAMRAGFHLRQPPRPAYGARRGIKPGSANKK